MELVLTAACVPPSKGNKHLSSCTTVVNCYCTLQWKNAPAERLGWKCWRLQKNKWITENLLRLAQRKTNARLTLRLQRQEAGSVHVGVHVRNIPQGTNTHWKHMLCGKILALFIVCCQQHVLLKRCLIHRKPYVQPGPPPLPPPPPPLLSDGKHCVCIYTHITDSEPQNNSDQRCFNLCPVVFRTKCWRMSRHPCLIQGNTACFLTEQRTKSSKILKKITSAHIY